MPCVGAGFYPARLYRTPISRVGGGVLDAPYTSHLQPCHCEERSDVAIRNTPAPHP